MKKPAKPSSSDIVARHARLSAAAEELLAVVKLFLDEFADDYCECKPLEDGGLSCLMDDKKICDYCRGRAAVALVEVVQGS
jgi:hypothetical protein